MVGIETPHLLELAAGVGWPVRLEGGEGAPAAAVEHGLRRLLLLRLVQNLESVGASGGNRENLLRGCDRGIEVPGVEALDRPDEQAVHVRAGDPLLAGGGSRDNGFELAHVDIGVGIARLFHELPGRREPGVHLEDEIAPDQAVFELPLGKEV